MQIWVDADACPAPVKEILYRVADRLEMALILVANAPLRQPPSKHIRTLQVEKGLDVADAKIAQLLVAGDLVITADIPLAARIVEKGALGLDPRGELYTEENVGERLSMRDLMQELRGAGMIQGGPAQLSNTDRQRFASSLDRILTRMLKGRRQP